MLELMFESLEVKSMGIALKPLLALYGGGLSSGLSVHMGEGTTVAVAVFNGFVIKDSIVRFDIAGKDVTEYL